MAVGSDAIPEKVKISLITICPVPFAFNVRSPFDESEVIDVISVRSLLRLSVIVSGSDPAVLMFDPPVKRVACRD